MVNMEISRVNNLEDQKQKILQFIRMRGPNITMRVSNYLRVDSLITSAFLSDLKPKDSNIFLVSRYIL
jgi:hypothetical protein